MTNKVLLDDIKVIFFASLRNVKIISICLRTHVFLDEGSS